MEEFNNAKRAIRALGITVKVSLKGCCIGCQDNGITEQEPALYQVANVFRSTGYINHQNIAGTPLAELLVKILDYYGVSYEWDMTESTAILININE